MTISRRTLLKYGMQAGLLAAVPRPLLAQLGIGAPEPLPPIQDPRVRELADRALEAARAAGATYADVRLTHTRKRSFSVPFLISDAEDMVAGVRVLVDGYWGFVASPVWSPDEMARIATEAVHHSRVSGQGGPREVDLASVPKASGHWTMPVQIDPFEVSPFEIIDYLESLRKYITRSHEFTNPANQCHFELQEKAFANSEGSYCTQRTYRSQGALVLDLRENGSPVYRDALDVLTPAGVGWELYKGQPLRELIVELMEEMKAHWKLPAKPVEVGRFAAVCDALTMAQLVSDTFGRATELDRALGYEANATGTSYLNDPFAMIGSHEMGASILTLRGNRSEPGGVATVQWDDEGVRPEEFTIIEDGVLRDFQTTRESAAWLKDSYTRTGAPVRSHACAYAPSALQAPIQHTPNLTLAPGAATLDFNAAMADMQEGVAIKALNVDMDFQALNGLAQTNKIYEVKNGRRVARIVGAGVLFRAPELWKGLKALGGEESLRRYGFSAPKGEPGQTGYHSVTAAPGVFEQLTLIDILRKA